MTTNEALARYNFISQLDIKSLSKEMKVKVMSMRIELKKIQEEFDKDVKEFTDGIVTDEIKQLASKQDRTEEEEAKYKELNEEINSSYNAYVVERANKEVDYKDKKFSDEEYAEIVGSQPEKDYTINGQNIPSGDFLEIIYTLFV